VLRLRIYRTKGSMKWEWEKPNCLILNKIGEPAKIPFRGRETSSELSNLNIKLPMGHPEDFLEAFTNLYSFIDTLIAISEGKNLQRDFQGVSDRVRGVTFIHACVESLGNNSMWVEFEDNLFNKLNKVV